jgi:hypothetical protein
MVITKTRVIWCPGRTAPEKGYAIAWTDFISYMHATRMGLVALHIIQKTPSAPYFIYATFEQSDNLLRADGSRVEDTEGRLLKPIPSTATSPQVCLQDDRPLSGQPGTAHVIVTDDPGKCLPAPKIAFCDTPGRRLYYRNANNNIGAPEPAPSSGNICVNKRDNDIPEQDLAWRRMS